MSMTETAKRYAYSHDGEMYHGNESTRESAVQEADGEPGDAIHTGVIVPYTGKQFIPREADWLIERIQETASDEAGECSEGWLGDLTPGMIADLDTRLADCIDAWLTAHGKQPWFYSVEDTEEHVIPGAVAEGA